MTAAQPGGMECPQCHQIDQVQKVSAIVKAGTATGALTGTTTGANGDANHTLARNNQTLLSKLLAAPKKPDGTTWSLWQRIAVGIFVVALLALVFGLAAATMLFTYVGEQQDPQLTIIVQGLLVGFFFCVFGIIALLSNSDRTYKKLRKKWKQSYYCHRCDGFFIPHKTSLIAPEDMQEWLRKRHLKK
jgi:hypothetical protein